MSVESPETTSTRPSWAWLAVLVFGGTIAWTLRFGAGYFLVPAACEAGDWVLHGVTLLSAAGAVVPLVLSVRWLRRPLDAPVRFSLLFGLALDVFFLGAILLEGSAVLFVDTCAKGAIP